MIEQTPHSHSHSHTVTNWIGMVRHGDDQALSLILGRYRERMVKLAQKKRAVGYLDGEDAVMSACRSFCQRAKESRLPDLQDRNHLLALLLTMTYRKIIRDNKDHTALKRGGGKVKRQSELGTDAGDWLLEAAENQQPTPEHLAAASGLFRVLLERLDDDASRMIAELKLSAYTNAEIAKRLKVSVRTVDRKLRLIRDQFERLVKLD